jgi:mono/diheme cytochrome c family protein
MKINSPKTKWIILVISLSFLLAACGMGMMGNFNNQAPFEYAGLTNPISANPDSLRRGELVYQTYCVSCHGETGLGDGPAAEAFDPPPAALALTTQLLSDANLFYRISEGGDFDPFNSAMPAFKETLNEEQRWDVINFIRSLGGGGMMPGGGMMNP